MNRLVLIGNGFDLAHGLKTSYHDFILQYLKDSLIEAVNNDNFRQDGPNLLYEDILLKVQLKNKYSNVNYASFINGCANIGELLDFMKRYEITKSFKSSFLKETIEHCLRYNWVDIENEYFKKILSNVEKCLNNKLRKNSYREELLLLNNELDYLSQKLGQYLFTLEVNQDDARNRIAACMIEDIKHDEVVTVKLAENTKPENIYILNFNYTNTTFKYYNYIKNLIPCKVNHIHGELIYDDNPLIFGFGDEIDKSYKQIEELNDNEYFKHIKSFKYFKTSNYHDLIRFVESNDFQVYVMGHSCGLSDRTLLNQIFEHDNCKSIKIHYYEKPDRSNDFIEKTFEISRHFHNKGVMRKKIVPLEKSYPLPQLEKM